MWSSLVSLSSVCLLSSTVYSHSWVECTDYDMSIDLEADDFDNTFYDSSCSGYARDRKYWSWHYWAYNSGIDYELFEDGTNMCESTIGSPDNDYSDTYDTTYPMANYKVGDMKRLIWPAKNHAGYDCQSDQLDHEMQLWVNLETNPTSDLGNDPDTDGWTLVIDWHTSSGETFTLADCTDGDCNVQSYIGIDNVPFQNCPKFCDNMDGAVCYGDFTVPNIFPEDGYYTFVWYWAFKSNEIYTHCFEAYVSGTDDYTGATVVTDTNSNSTKKGSNLNKSNNDGSGDTVSTVVWSIVAFVLIFGLIIIGCLILKKKEYIVCTENSIIWNGPNKQSSNRENGLATAVTSTSNVVATDGPRPTGTSAAGRPKGPPPPPRPTNA